MKLICVSIYFRGQRRAAFVSVPPGKKDFTLPELHKIFPEMNRLSRGETFSVG